ncbi:hypothetical protein M422DRAFT_247135 [Sphaerobolus stellatus SS14]|nr:hypothetical protein M422DRAFT_247135 [Sphaerobolus stellatus SS14]
MEVVARTLNSEVGLPRLETLELYVAAGEMDKDYPDPTALTAVFLAQNQSLRAPHLSRFVIPPTTKLTNMTQFLIFAPAVPFSYRTLLAILITSPNLLHLGLSSGLHLPALTDGPDIHPRLRAPSRIYLPKLRSLEYETTFLEDRSCLRHLTNILRIPGLRRFRTTIQTQRTRHPLT